MKKILLCAAVLFSGAGILVALNENVQGGFKPSLVPEYRSVSSRLTISRLKNSLLTPDGRFFSVRNRIADSDHAGRVSIAIRDFRKIEARANAMLSDLDSRESPFPAFDFSFWSGIRTNLPAPDGKTLFEPLRKNPAFVLALIYCGRIPEAKKAAEELLRVDSSSYGAYLLLALLSIRDESLKGYLSGAFSRNPARTAAFFDWASQYLPAAFPASCGWDFSHAFFEGMFTNRKKLCKSFLEGGCAHRLLELFHAKYYRECRLIPDFERRKNEFSAMESFLAGQTLNVRGLEGGR